MLESPIAQQRSVNIKSWIVCFTASLFIFYTFILMNLPNSLGDEILRLFSINAHQLGIISATYFYANLIFLVPAGILLDNFSTRWLILSGILLSLLGTICFLFPVSVTLLIVGRFITGIGSAFSFISCVKIASRWFPPYRMGLITGFMTTIAMSGGIVAQTPSALLISHFGWNKAIICYLVLGVIILLLVSGLVVEQPYSNQTIKKDISFSKSQLKLYWQDFHLSILNRQNWLAGIYASFIAQPIYLLGGLWGIIYLEQVHLLSKLNASYITSMIFVGGIIGTPCIGWISDKIRLRRLPMMISLILCFFTLFAIIYLPHPSFGLLLLLFLLLGVFTSSQVLSYPVVAESNAVNLTATASSIVSICAIGGGSIFEPLFGWLMGFGWSGKIENYMPIYSLANYRLAFSLFLIGIVASFIALLILKETCCKPRE